MTKLPPRKPPNASRREREFLYLHEVDALIAATRQTRAPIRNQALVMLLLCITQYTQRSHSLAFYVVFIFYNDFISSCAFFHVIVV